MGLDREQYAIALFTAQVTPTTASNRSREKRWWMRCCCNFCVTMKRTQMRARGEQSPMADVSHQGGCGLAIANSELYDVMAVDASPYSRTIQEQHQTT